jgi:CBS domain-containing protein
MYTVADVMTKAPLTVGPEEAIELAEALMRRARVRHLPVVQQGRLVGLVTERDISGAQSRAPKTVRDVMVTDVLTTHTSVPLRRAARQLFERKFGCLPVVDDQRAVIGILTESDFIRFAAEMVTDLDRLGATVARLQQPT